MYVQVHTTTPHSNHAPVTPWGRWARALFIAASTVGLSGCFLLTRPIDEKLFDEHMRWTFDYSVDACLDATEKALVDNNVPIEKVDHELRTVWSGRGILAESAHGEYGFHSATATGEGVVRRITKEHRWTLAVYPAPTGCVVRTTRYEVWVNNVKMDEFDWNQLNEAKERAFEPMRLAIADRLERGF